jgi:hypothetical protein
MVGIERVAAFKLGVAPECNSFLDFLSTTPH